MWFRWTPLGQAHNPKVEGSNPSPATNDGTKAQVADLGFRRSRSVLPGSGDHPPGRLPGDLLHRLLHRGLARAATDRSETPRDGRSPRRIRRNASRWRPGPARLERTTLDLRVRGGIVAAAALRSRRTSWDQPPQLRGVSFGTSRKGSRMRGGIQKKGKNYYAVVYDGIDTGTGCKRRR